MQLATPCKLIRLQSKDWLGADAHNKKDKRRTAHTTKMQRPGNQKHGLMMHALWLITTKDISSLHQQCRRRLPIFHSSSSPGAGRCLLDRRAPAHCTLGTTHSAVPRWKVWNMTKPLDIMQNIVARNATNKHGLNLQMLGSHAASFS